MRLLSIILSIYITSLILVPCACSSADDHRIEEVELTHQDHNHEHSGDCQDQTCTPFCICAGVYSNASLNSRTVSLLIELPIFNTVQYNSYSDMVTNPYYDTPFHPPMV